MMYEYMQLTEQVNTAHWGWTIGVFLTLIGMSGMGLFINHFVHKRILFYISTVAGILGTLVVVSHLHRMLNLPFAVFYSITEWSLNFGSWMFLGICLLSVLCVTTAFQSVVLLGWIKSAKLLKIVESKTVMHFNAILGIFCTAYSGFLLTQAEGISFWHTSLLPILWLISGLSCAFGVIEILEGVRILQHREMPWVRKASIYTEFFEIITIFSLIHVALTSDPGAAASAQSLLTGEHAIIFWVGAIFTGSVIPLVIGLTIGKHSVNATMIGGILAVCGALWLRSSVLFAGTFSPILF